MVEKVRVSTFPLNKYLIVVRRLAIWWDWLKLLFLVGKVLLYLEKHIIPILSKCLSCESNSYSLVTSTFTTPHNEPFTKSHG
jgi:Na+-translocating ferredoxin:NAD+ oxidoreductase RnfD subunit